MLLTTEGKKNGHITLHLGILGSTGPFFDLRVDRGMDVQAEGNANSSCGFQSL